jgi:hypothetical protein
VCVTESLGLLRAFLFLQAIQTHCCVCGECIACLAKRPGRTQLPTRASTVLRIQHTHTYTHTKPTYTQVHAYKARSDRTANTWQTSHAYTCIHTHMHAYTIRSDGAAHTWQHNDSASRSRSSSIGRPASSNSRNREETSFRGKEDTSFRGRDDASFRARDESRDDEGFDDERRARRLRLEQEAQRRWADISDGRGRRGALRCRLTLVLCFAGSVGDMCACVCVWEFEYVFVSV